MSENEEIRRSRGWCFTLNNYTIEDEYAIFELASLCKYIVAGKEIGASGTPHLQGYIYWDTLKSFQQVREILPWGVHIERQEGTCAEAIRYCKEDGDWFESGEAPMTQEEKGNANLNRWEKARQAVRDGRISDVPADIGIHLQKLEYLVSKEKLSEQSLEDTEEKMDWYYGPTGTGKSRTARENNPGAYLKMCNKWWDGYNGQDVVIIEDFDKRHDVLVHHLKIWVDRYSFPAEVKGGKIDIRPRKIIVTSNVHPRDIWTEDYDLLPLLRRFKITHFDKL